MRYDRCWACPARHCPPRTRSRPGGASCSRSPSAVRRSSSSRTSTGRTSECCGSSSCCPGRCETYRCLSSVPPVPNCWTGNRAGPGHCPAYSPSRSRRCATTRSPPCTHSCSATLTCHRELLRPLVDLADGMPLYALEYARMLVERGTLRQADRAWVIEPNDDLPMPESVHAVIANRLDLLDAGERAVLQAAAVVGPRFWPTAVAAALNTGVDGVERALRTLEQRDLVRQQPESIHGRRGRVPVPARARERRLLRTAAAGGAHRPAHPHGGLARHPTRQPRNRAGRGRGPPPVRRLHNGARVGSGSATLRRSGAGRAVPGRPAGGDAQRVRRRVGPRPPGQPARPRHRCRCGVRGGPRPGLSGRSERGTALH